MIAFIIIAVTAALVLVALSRTVRIVPQARAYPIERSGPRSTCANRSFPSRLNR
jgi:hypothetical protein